MVRSVQKLTGALGLLLIATSFTSGSATASSGGQLIMPEPMSSARKADTGTTQVGEILNPNARPGDILRIVNVQSSNADGEGKAAAKTVEKKKPAAKARSAKRKTSSARKTASKPVSAGTGRVKFASLIREAAQKHGVPEHIAKAVVQVESNFNPRARGAAGEVGLMQIKPATARGLGYRGSVKALYDPETNIEWGMRYLAGAHQRAGGDLCGTILRYNAGHYAKRMNPISRRYCQKVKIILASR